MNDVWSAERAKHPRPDFVREPYCLLDGPWGFAFDDEDRGLREGWYRPDHPLERQILVPFCYQSAKSGIGDRAYHPILWYKRNFLCPDWAKGRRLLLHLGAVDESCSLYLNGRLLLHHVGGYTPFECDITDTLCEGENQICLRVTDSRDLAQPRGKQYWEDGLMACWYTPTSGIWQSVYLDASGDSRLDRALITPDIDLCKAEIDLCLNGDPPAGLEARYALYERGRLVREGRERLMRRRQSLSLDMRDGNGVDSVRYWQEGRPELYDLKIELTRGESLEDRVLCYFGMRKIEVCRGQLLLNHQPLRLKMVLNQGYWPESLMTPPDGEALRRDLEWVKAFGFNGVRMHQKIEDPRFYHLCDLMGLLCWGEMPSSYEFSPDSVSKNLSCLQDFILRDYNHPSIITWVPVNESWGLREIFASPAQQAMSLALYHCCKALDQTRLVSGNDGWEQTKTDIIALHDYTAEGEKLQSHFACREKAEKSFVEWRMSFAQGFEADPLCPMMVTEYGGIAMDGPEEREELQGIEAWGYHDKAESQESFLERYRAQTRALLALPHISGICYTQLTDVMQEINGLLTPGRRPKVDPEAIARINRGEA